MQLLLAVGIDGHGPLASAIELAEQARASSRNDEEAVEHVTRNSVIFGSAGGFVTGIASLLASLAAGLLWDRDGSSATFLAGAFAAGIALAMLSLLPEERPSA